MESNNNLGPNEVLVLINYPEGFEGKRHHKDGETYPMSIETANLLVKRGIATIQGDSSFDENIEEAESEINQRVNAPELTMEKHIVTEEDLVNNPEMVGQGIQVGDEILIPFDAPIETPEVIEGEAIEEVSDEAITEEVVATENVSDTTQVDAPIDAPEVDSKKAKKSASKPGK
jgi:hypothetical protein